MLSVAQKLKRSGRVLRPAVFKVIRPLFVLAFTGFLLSYPAVLETLTGSSGMENGETGRSITSTAVPNYRPTGLPGLLLG